MGHTPGPWKAGIDNCGGGLNIVDASGRRIAHTAEHRGADGTVILTEEARDNARLIAEAPAMLAALKRVENHLWNTSGQGRDMVEPQLAEDVRSIIARIEGTK